MTDIESWQCPYCGHFQVITGTNFKVGMTVNQGGGFVKISEHGDIELYAVSIACLNPVCKKLTLTVGLAHKTDLLDGGVLILPSDPIKKWELLPDSIAKPQPDYIPEPIKNDYEEACKIAHISPKAAATLARRCLQGMIRDFCKISEQTLHSEIEKLKAEHEENKSPQGVTMESIEAIDNVRMMGNIGAHMEKDVNTIVDIEPDEATSLITLIEMLFKEWYIARYERSKRLQNLQETTNQKKQQQTPHSDQS